MIGRLGGVQIDRLLVRGNGRIRLPPRKIDIPQIGKGLTKERGYLNRLPVIFLCLGIPALSFFRIGPN